VGAHKLFGRRGKDLTITVPVTFAEAALGATVKVPTLDGSVTLRVPQGTPTGKTFRVRGRGAHTPQGTGDLLVTVEVAVPSTLSDDERAAVESLAENLAQNPRSHLEVES
jgi:molecular chaperone DnaJ